MKKYDVCGIGNALVDTEIKVHDDFFQQNKIDKGVMTLIDDNRRLELAKMTSTLPVNRACGGSAANTVIAVSQFGGKGFYSCKVASDENGKFYLADMKENGVEVNLDPNQLENGTTGTCLVMVTPDADRTMNTYLGITSTFSRDEVRFDIIEQSKFLYIEGYLVAAPNGQNAAVEAAQFARKAGTKVAITFSDPNMVKFFKGNFEAIIGSGVDLIFCNESEAFEYTGKNDLKEAREELKKIAKSFVITQGENGAMIWDGETFLDIEPYNVNAIDSNGAGDMFAGAFLYAVTNGHTMASAGKLASLASSRVVAQYGPRLKWHQAKDIHHQLFGAQ
jgi:sugar/nucleoside kinase (ribokinase family)